jgi:hypothetical protein
MSCEQILNKWRRYIPPRVPLSDVIKVIQKKFEKYEYPKRGSHLKIYDSRLEWFIRSNPGKIDFSYDGRFTIPIYKGKEVKKVYVKRILIIIDIMEEV